MLYCKGIPVYVGRKATLSDKVSFQDPTIAEIAGSELVLKAYKRLS